MASGSYNIETLSMYRTLPLQYDVIPYSTNTIFAVGPSTFLEPYTFYDLFSTNNYMDPSTMSTYFISTLNAGLTSTTAYIGKQVVSTLSYSSNFQRTSNAPSWPVVISTPTYSLGSLSSLFYFNQNYNIFTSIGYNINLTTNDTYINVSTVGVFGDYIPNTQESTYITRVSPNTYTTIQCELAYPLNGNRTPQSTFYYLIFLQSSGTVINPDPPTYDLFVPAKNNMTIRFIPA